MIETIIALVVALIGGAFFYGRNTIKNKQTKVELESTIEAKKNYEKISQMDDDDQLAEFDRLRSKRRELL